MTDDTLSVKQRAIKFQRLVREHSTRFYIQFSYQSKLVNGEWTYPKAVWPILFMTRDQALLAMRVLPIWANNPPKHHPGHVKSASVEYVRIRVNGRQTNC